MLGLLGQFFDPFEMLWTCFRLQKTYLGSKIDNFGPIWPKKWKISWKHKRKVNATRSPRPIFEPVRDRNILKCCGPILGSKNTHLGSKIDIFGPIWPKKWKISWKHNRKRDDTRSPGPIFWADQDRNIFKMLQIYFRVQKKPLRVQNWHFWTYLA